MHQQRGTFACAQHRGQALLRILVGNAFANQAGVADDRGEQVVEIVSDAAGEEADALQLLRLPQAFFVSYTLRNVHEYANGATGAPLDVQKRNGVADDVGPASVRKH